MSDAGNRSPKGAGVKGKKGPPPSQDGFMSLVSFWEQTGDAPGREPEIDPLEVLREKEEEIKRQGEEILANARAEAAKVEEEAYQKGFAQGEEEGRSEGKKSFDEAVQRLELMFAAIERQLSEENTRYQEELMVLVTTMVDRLVQHEVSTNPRVIQACLMRALSFVVEKSVVKVHLHPDDFSRIREASLENPSLLEGKRRIELMEDGSIAEGGCFLETDFGDVDASIDHGREKLFEAVDRAFRVSLAEENRPAAENDVAPQPVEQEEVAPSAVPSVEDGAEESIVRAEAEDSPVSDQEDVPAELPAAPDAVAE